MDMEKVSELSNECSRTQTAMVDAAHAAVLAIEEFSRYAKNGAERDLVCQAAAQCFALTQQANLGAAIALVTATRAFSENHEAEVK